MTVTQTSLTRVCPDCRVTYPYQQAHVCAHDAPRTLPNYPAVAITDVMVGAVLGERYQIEAYLQGGGMGVVYKARHIVLGKPIAIKIMREVRDPAAQQRFLLEAKSACQIDHAHIVDITDFGVLDDGRPYLVMEFLKGQPLDEVIGRGPLPALRACRVGEQIALGIQAVHDKGIIHRDLKPGNVFIVDRDGKDYVKILDFGIAKVVAGERAALAGEDGGGRPQRLTQEGAVMGTPEYMAPELSMGQDADQRIDQYALGCILYEMLTGQAPFLGAVPAATMVMHVTTQLVPPRERRPGLGIPASLEQVVLRAMARERQGRFPGMRELAQALSREGDRLAAVKAEGPAAPPDLLTVPQRRVSGPTIVVKPTPPRWARWRVPLLAGLGVGLAGLAGLGLYGSLAPHRPAPPPVVQPKPPQPMVKPPESPTPVPAAAKDPGPPRDPKPQPTRPRPPLKQVVFENQNAIPLQVQCSGRLPCQMAPQKTCSLPPPTGIGACVISGSGFRKQVLTYGDLREQARKGVPRLKIRLVPL